MFDSLKKLFTPTPSKSAVPTTSQMFGSGSPTSTDRNVLSVGSGILKNPTPPKPLFVDQNNIPTAMTQPKPQVMINTGTGFGNNTTQQNAGVIVPPPITQAPPPPPDPVTTAQNNYTNTLGNDFGSIQAQQDYNDTENAYNQQSLDMKGQGRGMWSNAVGGQQGQIEQVKALKLVPLTQRLALLQQRQQMARDAAKTQLDFAQANKTAATQASQFETTRTDRNSQFERTLTEKQRTETNNTFNDMIKAGYTPQQASQLSGQAGNGGGYGADLNRLGLPNSEVSKVKEQVSQIDASLAKIDAAIKTDTGFRQAVGFGLQKFNPLVGNEENPFMAGSDAAGFHADLDQLKSMLALPHLNSIKGATSDKDIIFLKSIATSLSESMSETKFNLEFEEIKKALGRVKARYGLEGGTYTTEEGASTGASSTGGLTPTGGKPF